MVKAMGVGLVTTYSDGSIYLSMFLLKITSYGQKKGYCGSVACPLFWVAVLEDFLAKVPKHNNNGSSNNNDIGLEFPTLRPQNYFFAIILTKKRMCVK